MRYFKLPKLEVLPRVRHFASGLRLRGVVRVLTFFETLRTGIMSTEFPPIVTVKYPLGYSKEAVEDLEISMDTKFKETGYRVVVIPEELDLSVLGEVSS